MNRFRELRKNYKKAALEVEKCENDIREACAEVFPKIDENGTGYVGMGEFLSVFLDKDRRDDMSEQEIRALMAKFSRIDTSGDGKLSLEEITNNQLAGAGVPEALESKSCYERFLEFCKKVRAGLEKARVAAKERLDVAKKALSAACEKARKLLSKVASKLRC